MDAFSTQTNKVLDRLEQARHPAGETSRSQAIGRRTSLIPRNVLQRGHLS